MTKKIYTEYKAEELLKKYVPIAKNQLVNDIKQIKLKKYPLVLKIISQQALHKTDIGGVIVVNSKDELEKKFNKLIQISKKNKIKLEGILVQEFIDGYQLIVGIKKDPVFNHVILLGAGGIYTKILKDISIRACPITVEDANSMIEDLKTKDILYCARGEKANISKLKRVLVNISKLPSKYKNIEELDINPLIVNKNTVLVVDARIIFG